MSAETELQTITLEYELSHPPDKVWRTLTDPELLARWIMDNDMKPVVGHRFTFRAQPSEAWDGIVYCEVLEVDRPRRIAYTWRGGPPSSPLDTVVTWTLTPRADGGTHLVLEHSGFVPTNKFAFKGARIGWQRNIGERLVGLLPSIEACQ